MALLDAQRSYNPPTPKEICDCKEQVRIALVEVYCHHRSVDMMSVPHNRLLVVIRTVEYYCRLSRFCCSSCGVVKNTTARSGTCSARLAERSLHPELVGG